MARASRLTLGALLIVLAGCTTLYRNHGYVPTDDQLALVQIGDSQQTVADTVGRPVATGVLDDSGWYFVRSRWRDYAWQAPVEVDREVVAISFTPQGTVSNVERFGLQQGRVVPLSRRVTESNVQGVGFLQQLFRNVGNFNPADFLDGGDR
ncbi:outer membrane protein assembly factor BamE [Oceaniovalibus guishaninsula]|nr:outer membrane protein assembly factor BamE [Oceaniovalibus guishaninsula]